MPIQRLELRGISRLPSDRMTSDGGVAESVNFVLEHNESAPMVMPEDITSQTVGYYSKYRAIYVHKTASYTNYIGLSDDNEMAYMAKTGYWTEGLAQIPITDEVRDVTSIGNILVVLTLSGPLYFIFKDNEYIPLGSSIPEPLVEFETTRKEGDYEFMKASELIDGAIALDALILYSMSPDDFNKKMSKYGTAFKEETTVAGASYEYSVTEAVNATSAAVWDWLNSKAVMHRNEGEFVRPVFARYAVRLYDGSYVYASAPILLGAGGAVPVSSGPGNAYYKSDFATVTASVGDTLTFGLFLNSIYSSKVNIKYDIPQGWKDLISSVDVFLSTDVYNPQASSLLKKSLQGKESYLRVLGFEGERTLEEELLSKGNYYRVLTIEPDKFASENWYTEDIKPLSQDDLVVKPRLDFDYRTSLNPSPADGLMTYNSRVVGYGIRETLARGYRFPQSASWMTDTDGAAYSGKLCYKFYIRTDEGLVKTVLAHYGKDDSEVVPSGLYETVAQRRLDSYGLIMYPDSRCFKVEVMNITTTKSYEFTMKPHPSLECAYYFCGDLGKTLLECLSEMEGQALGSRTEDREIVDRHRLVMSEVDNPFVIPVSGRIKIGSRILSVATTTTALATGQYDQAPLYIFTEEGIEAQRIKADGTFGPHDFVSRDVAKWGTICPIDQAIIFTSERGVMMLTQGDIKCLSTFMMGRPVEDPELWNADYDWRTMIEGVRTDDDFRKFISEARYVYDYAGKRLVCINGAVRFQYVYSFATESWHKMYTGDGLRLLDPLNSYPEAHAVAGKRQISIYSMAEATITQEQIAKYLHNYDWMLTAEQRAAIAAGTEALEADLYPESQVQRFLEFLADGDVYYMDTFVYGVSNLSTYRLDEQYNTTPCFLMTRAFDLDMPDVIKSIKDIKIRGYFDQKNVRYLLYSSGDGKKYRRVWSLKTAGSKLYRIAIYARLSQDERISWIDIEFEPRFQNKLR